MNPRDSLGIMDALENLNALVDADSLAEIEVIEDELIVSHKPDEEGSEREIYWVPAGADDRTLQAIRTTFKSVHDYLETFFVSMRERGDEKRLIEGVNTIMVLVSEATKKLERFDGLFKEKVVTIPEYKELQDFYKNTVIRESYQAFATTPIPQDKPSEEQKSWEAEHLDLFGEEERVIEETGVHILNDVEVIKHDHLYDLFFLKNEAGHNFYTYELARNIKLACNFGEFAKGYLGEDPLLQIKNWEDKTLHLKAQKILEVSHRQMERFYSEAMKYKGLELAMNLHNALMALMLAANPHNLIRQFALKGAHHYFYDFVYFLREVVHDREFEKLVLYGTPSGKPFFEDAYRLTHTLCNALHTLPSDEKELEAALEEHLQIEKPPKKLSEWLCQVYDKLIEVLEKHPSGPVFKALDRILEEQPPPFDPMLLGNFPSGEWKLGDEIEVLRIPCPTTQEWIGEAKITEEFKTFLRGLPLDKRVLLFNLQDRTSWREHARAHAIEELSKQAEFAEQLTVITLAKESEFYWQAGPYGSLEETTAFVTQFKEHLDDQMTGFWFPRKVKQELFPHFVDKVLTTVQEHYFFQKERLSLEERLDFIELVFVLIELKVIELIQPHYLCFMSKDGLDVAGSSSVAVMAFLALCQGVDLERKQVERILFGPTLMQRERLLQPERFARLQALLKRLENRGECHSAFAPLFKEGTLEREVQL